MRSMYYEEVFEKLNIKNIRYLIVGGIAVNLYGIPRTTMDLDLMVDLSKNNLLSFINAMNDLGYEPKAPVGTDELIDAEKRKSWQEKKNMIVFSFIVPEKPYKQIDFFLNNPINFEKAFKSKEIIKTGGPKLPLISLKDLIELKRISGRRQDLADIESLQKIEEIINEEQ